MEDHYRTTAPVWPVLIGVAVALAAAASALAATCWVPAQYPSIGEAAAAPQCSLVNIAPGLYEENFTVGRSVSLIGTGSGAVVRGRVRVRGGGVAVSLQSITIDVDGCSRTALEVQAGATSEPDGIVILDSGGGSPCPIFLDGFEAGYANRWSVFVP